ncbi:hypothetical protein KGO95_03335 [Patescibacteria group bacterium]|nr:hypothetical protein [Patescibacteria group bacterium]
MDTPHAHAAPQEQSVRRIPAGSAHLPDGRIVELVYDPELVRTRFAVYDGATWTLASDILLSSAERLVPYSPRNNLLINNVVLLPSMPEEYGSTTQLLDEIRSFIHRYVDVSPLYERIASSYVLFSWVYDAFNELPYLRIQGEPGSGKTRFLLTVGSLCYKPIFASGASTISPLFRILDAFRGTLIIDESDFRQSDERSEMVKILNNGNVRGFPVLRSEASPQTKEFNPRAYAVFGPKIVATRGLFEDRALESRFLTEPMGERELRRDIPINLPQAQQREALSLRNKLLLFRFRNLAHCTVDPSLVDRAIEPRLSQIFVPLLSTVDDPAIRQELQGLAREYHDLMVGARGLEAEAQILEVVRELWTDASSSVALKDITDTFAAKFGEEYDRKITPKWVGYLLRTKLHLVPMKRHGIFVLPQSEYAKLDRLSLRYDVPPPASPEQSPEVPPAPLFSEQTPDASISTGTSTGPPHVPKSPQSLPPI